VLDLFQPPKVKPSPTRVVLLADVEPQPQLTYKTSSPAKARVPAERPRKVSDVERKNAQYWNWTDAQRAERKEQSRQWYLDNRERALAQAKARYEALSPEEKKAYSRRNLERARARRAAKAQAT
jgi:hypothetical protein